LLGQPSNSHKGHQREDNASIQMSLSDRMIGNTSRLWTHDSRKRSLSGQMASSTLLSLANSNRKLTLHVQLLLLHVKGKHLLRHEVRSSLG
jgi:hypothetical protein